MKILLNLLCCTLLFTPFTMAKAADTPLEHLNEVNACIDNLKNETWQYLKSVTKGRGARKVERKREDLLEEIKKQKMAAKRIHPYRTDSRVKDAVIEYLELSYIVLKEDYDKILDMEDIAEQSYDAMEAYLLAKQKANTKLDSAFTKMDKVYRKFAEEHDIRLIDDQDRINKQIEKSNEVLAYYNEIYLIFFKCFKQEVYVMDALQRIDISGVEQNSNTLKSFSEEALEKLHAAKSYRGDGSMKTAAQQIIKFYQKEANEDFPIIVDFYLKKDKFEKAQNAFESKSKRDRTQEDVDKLNIAGKEYNEAVTIYNQLNESMNKERSKVLNAWNDKSSKFFDLHAN